MRYLRISNRGLANPIALTTLGVSLTRGSEVEGLIGQFGSGTKHAISVFLRLGLEPVIYVGSLRMSFFTRTVDVDGEYFDQVWVKYSGKWQGKSKNTSEDLGWTTQWGVKDWKNDVGMAMREFVSNAIDGTLKVGEELDREVMFSEVDMNQVRAIRGGEHTAVYVPLCDEVINFMENLDEWFLHFDGLEKMDFIEKRNPGSGVVNMYRKGVRVHQCSGSSAFDYNLEDINLSESRNASEWDCKYQVSMMVADAPEDALVHIFECVKDNNSLWEGSLMGDSVSGKWEKSLAEARGKVWSSAWKRVFGEKVALGSDSSSHLAAFVNNKGYSCVVVPTVFRQALESYGCLTDAKVLNDHERSGRTICDASSEAFDCLDRIWVLLGAVQLLNGKDKPGLAAFSEIMDGGTQCNGEYKDGVCYVHRELAGDQLFKVLLEEVVHHITGAGDMSRDIQDYLFRLVMELAKAF